jgi:hypothetical protein
MGLMSDGLEGNRGVLFPSLLKSELNGHFGVLDVSGASIGMYRLFRRASGSEPGERCIAGEVSEEGRGENGSKVRLDGEIGSDVC